MIDWRHLFIFGQKLSPLLSKSSVESKVLFDAIHNANVHPVTVVSHQPALIRSCRIVVFIISRLLGFKHIFHPDLSLGQNFCLTQYIILMSIRPPLLATSQLSLTDRQTNSRLENTKLNWEQNNVSQELQIITFWPLLHYKREGLVSRRCCWGRLINSNHFPPKTISRRIFADLGIRPRLRANCKMCIKAPQEFQIFNFHLGTIKITTQLQNVYQSFSSILNNQICCMGQCKYVCASF